jgi:hypothetical protein
VPDLSPWFASAMIALLVGFLLWFALGTQRNVRRGNELLAWLQGGLPLLGRKTTMRWMGSTAVELRIGDASDPFREATVLAVLEPRDVAWLWALTRGRGRRDFLILRANLRRAPRVAVEVADRAGWTGRDGPRHEDEEEWRPVTPWAAGLDARVAAGADSATARRLWDQVAAAAGTPWRLSVRRTVPHLEVHVLAPDMEQVSAQKVVSAFRSIALEIGR